LVHIERIEEKTGLKTPVSINIQLSPTAGEISTE
jgi:hypothetical protein